MGRLHIVLADDLIYEVDRVVGERGRSRFISEAVQARLDQMRLERAARRAIGAIDPDTHPEWRDRRATTAWVRSVRKD